MRLLHHATTYYYAALALAIVSVWLPEGNWRWAVTALMFTAVVGIFLDMRYHRGRLCERCAARVPLNGGHLADRYRRLFRVWHWLADKVWRVPASLVLLAVVTLPLPKTMGGTLQLAGLGVALWIADQHLRLRPWCPYCRWGDGGDEETTPVSSPAPSTSR